MQKILSYSSIFFLQFIFLYNLSIYLNAALTLNKNKRTSQNQPNNNYMQPSATQISYKYPLCDTVSDNNPITNDDAIILAEQIYRTELQLNEQSYLAITIHGKPIGDAFCRQISAFPMNNLRWLSLNNSKLGDEGCKYLNKLNCHHLNRLYLSGNRILQKGCQYLSKGYWPALKALQLRNNRIGNRGCRHLARANWRFLNQLSIKNNGIRAKGCEEIVKSQWDLRWIYADINYGGFKDLSYSCIQSFITDNCDIYCL